MSAIRKITLESFGGLSEERTIDLNEVTVPYVLLIGDGSVGKTSMLTFLRAILSGNVAEESVNNLTGKANGEIEFEKGGRQWKAVLRKTRKSDTLTLFVKDEGLDMWLKKGGREAIRELVGEIWIDPVALQRMKPEKQVQWYKDLCKIDTNGYDEKIESYREERTLIGREVKDLNGYISQSDDTLDVEANVKLYAEERSIESLLSRQQQLSKQKERKYRIKEQLAAQNQAIVEAKERIHAWETQILSEKVKIEAAESKAIALMEENAAIPTDIDLSFKEVTESINDNQNYNTKRAKFLSVLEKYKSLEKKKAEYDGYSDKITTAEAEKNDYIRTKQINVEGLVLKDDGLFLNDVPVSALSTTEIVTLTKLIQQQINPNGIPIMIIDDGESMGSKFIDEIDHLARTVPDMKIFMSIMNRTEKELKIEFKDKL